MEVVANIFNLLYQKYKHKAYFEWKFLSLPLQLAWAVLMKKKCIYFICKIWFVLFLKAQLKVKIMNIGSNEEGGERVKYIIT